MTSRKPAPRPKPRTVTVTLNGTSEYPGWQATMKADFPAAVLAQLQSGEMDNVIKALDRIVISHNLPDENDKLASSMAEVDPYDGLLTMAGALFDELGKLPAR